MKIPAGSILAIPSSTGPKRAKVLFVSRRYKDVVLLSFRGFRVWTSTQRIKSGTWKIGGTEDLSKEEEAMAMCIVAGNVISRDEFIRAATPDDQNHLPQMDVVGCGLVEKKAANAEA